MIVEKRVIFTFIRIFSVIALASLTAKPAFASGNTDAQIEVDKPTGKVEGQKGKKENLQEAIADGDIDEVKKLIEEGADVNARDEIGRAPLHFVKNKAVAELLIAKGADVNARTKDGWTLLHTMAWNGNEEMVKLLLENGADINAKHNKDHTPLHFAVRTGKKEVVKLLLTNGALVNAKDQWGYTPLHWAAKKGYRNITELLLANGADTNTKNNDGLSPLEHAAKGKHQKVVEVLIKNGTHLGSELRNYGIVEFKQNDNAYTQQNIWKYEWDIELNPDVSENNTFQILKTTKVISGQADLHPNIAVQKIINKSVIEKKYKSGPLKCRLYVGDSEPSFTYHSYGQKLSGWLCGFYMNQMSRSKTMLFPGKEVTNFKPNKRGDFVGLDLELLSFETSEENVKYEHNVIIRKTLVLAPKVEPLPEDQVDEMFDRIEKDEDIDLKLIYQSLIGPQTTLRAYAARYLGAHGNNTSIPYLIDALADESMHVGAKYIEAGMATTRYWANDSLKKLTGNDFGFIWNDPRNKRDEAIKRWQQWWQKKKPAVQKVGCDSPR